MMTLKNKEVEISISVEGYAYPFARDYWDANWLSISISINDNFGFIFEKNDTCLLTTELITLREWFQKVLEHKIENCSSIDFMEPSLSFGFEHDLVDILLKYNLNPNYEQDFDSVYKVSFKLNQNELIKILITLENCIRKFPEKMLKG